MEYDICNISEGIQQANHEIPKDIMDKISELSFSNMYTKLNNILEHLALIMGENYGMGISIMAITCGIKLIYAPIMVKCNINMLKLKLLDPET